MAKEATNTNTFTVDGETYEIAFNIKRIQMYEAGHMPIMTSFMKNGGSFSISELCDMTAYGLRKEGGGYVSPKQGREMAENLLEENGYFALYNVVADALQRDCGFFFKMQEA